MSKFLNERAVGDFLNIKGPFGKFMWNEDVSEKVFCLVAGSGITPFRAFFEYFIDKKLSNPIKLLYSCGYGDNVIFEKELEELVEQIQNGKYLLSITRDPKGMDRVRSGRIDAPYLSEQIIGFEDANYFLCGTPGFITAMINNLVELGTPREKIKREQWG